MSKTQTELLAEARAENRRLREAAQELVDDISWPVSTTESGECFMDIAKFNKLRAALEE